ncbi:hypothetical protein BDY19DRAFT_475810 [Irpex rosettiformis]|uniref:Uncharacterized protein n=1 Tax=Irpex rosettiformis TaxID=378272 RepID=A0ACB8TS68_9APHY|nr:hypothetical protein BDY19DRAFT_475810 [Irpex rosettiformis]
MDLPFPICGNGALPEHDEFEAIITARTPAPFFVITGSYIRQHNTHRYAGYRRAGLPSSVVAIAGPWIAVSGVVFAVFSVLTLPETRGLMLATGESHN